MPIRRIADDPGTDQWLGDEELDRCIEPSLFLKSAIAASGLAVFPKTGHVVNLEEPDLFNLALSGDFLARVDAGRWPVRDPRSIGQKSVPEPWNVGAAKLI